MQPWLRTWNILFLTDIYWCSFWFSFHLSINCEHQLKRELEEKRSNRPSSTRLCTSDNQTNDQPTETRIRKRNKKRNSLRSSCVYRKKNSALPNGAQCVVAPNQSTLFRPSRSIICGRLQFVWCASKFRNGYAKPGNRCFFGRSKSLWIIAK